MMKNENMEIKQSKLIMASYGFGPALNQFFRNAFVAFGFFFYEVEIGLNVWLAALGYTLYLLWNAVNDPLVGFLTNRPIKFLSKWGKKFPWILISGLPWIFSYILIFMPPNVDPISGAWIIFLWLLVTTCLFDTFNSIWYVNFYSLFPIKFKSPKERRTASGIITPVGVIGIALGGIVPPLFVTYGDVSSYLLQAWMVVLIALIMFFLGIPGWRDDKIDLERNALKVEENKKQPLMKTVKLVLKHDSFRLFLFYTFTFQILTYSVQASIPYIVRFVFGMAAGGQLLLQVSFLLGAIITIPIWVKLSHKIDYNKKVILMAALVLSIASILLTFVPGFSFFIIMIVFWGIGLGGFWAMNRPTVSDVIDESLANTEMHLETVYTGINIFTNRLAQIVQVFIFAAVHTLTGFAEGDLNQSSAALFGIRLHAGLIPAIFLIIGALIFWKSYKLTPDKLTEIKVRIKELGL